MKRFKLDCIRTNSVHTAFRVFDHLGANCGQLTVRTQDARDFVGLNWNGDVFWNGLIPPIDTPKSNEVFP